MRKIWGKIRVIDRNLRKNEESETLAHPGLWDWLHSKLQSLKSKSSRIVISDQSILRFKYKSLRFELNLQTFGIKPEISKKSNLLDLNLTSQLIDWSLITILTIYFKSLQFRVYAPDYRVNRNEPCDRALSRSIFPACPGVISREILACFCEILPLNHGPKTCSRNITQSKGCTSSNK